MSDPTDEELLAIAARAGHRHAGRRALFNAGKAAMAKALDDAGCDRCQLDRDGFGYQGMLPATHLHQGRMKEKP